MEYKGILNSIKSKADTGDIENSISKKETNLEGKLLQVYWTLLEKGPSGIRDIQKSLNYSTPSTVSYQMKKLIDFGIVSKEDGSDKYFIKEEVKTGILGFYFKFGYKLIPRFSLYLILDLLGFGIFFILFLLEGVDFLFQPIAILFILYQSYFSFIFVLESRRIWKMKP